MAPPSSKIPSNLIARSKIVIDNIEYVFDNDTRHPRCDIQPVRHFAVTQFALCPKISLPIPSVTRLEDGSVCIEKRGCYRVGSFQTIDDKLILCVDDYFRNLPNDEEIQYSEIQSVLSIVCTSLSVLCLLLTLVTYAIFSTLRKLPGMNNMALISTLICAQLLYQFGINRNESSIVCGILGISIHFTWLASICWMNVCTYHMFHTFVWDMMRPSMRDELSRNRYLLFYALYSYLLPVIFISANVVTSLVNSDFKNYGYGPDICYISSSTLIAYTFAVPVGILLVINLILFLVVIYKIQRAPKMKAVNHNSRRNFLVFIKLSCITGLFWLVGFLYQWLKFAALGYVFIILNASQGVFIMFAFVCNKRILDLYKKRFAEKDVGKTSTNSHETNFTNLTKTNTN
ncbi:hypothetical protein FSP39_008743 [Pinctada imbricata]|uniref:G-protein coupled receptors family 2 profile 2 domain-containing protein n=1 Tax=Pinctada imbricata TaxID=66713 RepID=A0AA89BZ13_PINIB|nr:hypothetical protein FSP39_008743 [Pinctada imbricata]